MKVLLTTDAVGGVWTHSLDLARGLAQQGVQVTLAVMGPSPTPEMEQEAAQIPGLKLEVRPYKLEWMDDPWDDVHAAGDWLLALEKAHRVDLVHSNSYTHGALPFGSPVVIGAHSSIHGWWDAVVGDAPPDRKWRTYQQKVHEGLQGADLIVAPTAWMLRSLKRHYGPVTTPMRTIRNGRSPFSEPDHKEDLVLWVGRVWDEAKNVRLLDQAAERGIPWRTRVIGDDRHPETRNPVRLHHVEQSGRVPAKQLTKAYARAGVFVSTAHYEPFGLGPLEAAQAGCALVLPRIGSLQETWEDDALFYKEDDPAELHHLLHELALDPDLHIRHCERARQRAQDLTHHKMAADYFDAYRRLMDKSSAPSSAHHGEPSVKAHPTRRPVDAQEGMSPSGAFAANPFRSSPSMLPSDAALPASHTRTRSIGPYRTDISRPVYMAEKPRTVAPPTRTQTPSPSQSAARKARTTASRPAGPTPSRPSGTTASRPSATTPSRPSGTTPATPAGPTPSPTPTSSPRAVRSRSPTSASTTSSSPRMKRDPEVEASAS